MTVLDTVTITPCGLAALIREAAEMTLIVDCRGFTEYNESHVRHSMNAFFSKLIRRRLFENKLDDNCLLHQLMSCSIQVDEKLDLVLYAEEDKPRNNKRRIASCNAPESTAKIMRVLRSRLEDTDKFRSVMVLEGGFKQFASQYPQLCESSEGMTRLPQSLSQPCLSQPTGDGITLITPNIYLGSQMDSLDEKMLKALDISVVINLSVTCPKSVCIKEDKNFMRIPVNDSYQEKLSPYFPKAFEFLEKCRRQNKKCLIHCLAGISRSPTLCISYIMRYMQMGSDDAYRYVKERRPSISPNFNFMGQLLEYENVLIKDQVLRPDQASRHHRHMDHYAHSDLCPPKVPKSASSHCVFPGPPRDSEDGVVHESSEEIASDPELPVGGSDPEIPSTVINSNGKRHIPMEGLHRPKALGLPTSGISGIPAGELPSPSTELSRLSFEGGNDSFCATNPCFSTPIPSFSTTGTSNFESSSGVVNPFFGGASLIGESSQSSSSTSGTSGSQTAPVVPRCRMKGFFKAFSRKCPSPSPSTSTPSSSAGSSSSSMRPECLRSSGIVISTLATTEEEEVESPESGFNEETTGTSSSSSASPSDSLTTTTTTTEGCGGLKSTEDSGEPPVGTVVDDDSASIGSASSLEFVCL